MLLQARIEVRERLRESEKALSQNIYEHGVDEAGFGRSARKVMRPSLEETLRFR